ncbi:rho guanine nucleotide exchange factor 3-like [Rhopilema esculentum]|uniref:rho guanine nucleotide exchange factor 3-like n=1 Tax=Rhopilema esculentum TaxID=499914 RepID=UPI0031DE9502
MPPIFGFKRAKRRLRQTINVQSGFDGLPGGKTTSHFDERDSCRTLSPVVSCSSIVMTPGKRRRTTCFEPVLVDKTNTNENAFPENSQFYHVPIIKSASKTDLKEQKRMMKLRSNSTTLQSIENKQPNKRKFEASKELTYEDDEPKPSKMKISLNRNSQYIEEMNYQRPTSDDFETVSLASTDSCFKREEGTRNSWRNRLRKMASIGGVFTSPRVGKQLKRSPSLRSEDAMNTKTKIKKYVQLPTPVRRRSSKLWLETVADFNCNIKECLTSQQIKRQEAIFELYCGEEDLIEDLKLLKEVYFNEMSKLNLLNEEELAMLFGNVECLLPLHQDLLAKLKGLRNKDGSIDEIGQVLINWIPGLEPYVPYCAQQFNRKHFLDNKLKVNSAFADFLQRCLESPFSRKLDLWNFLDAPRNRLVKYPLLFSTIEKLTSDFSKDKYLLHDSIKGIEEIISQADKETGRSKCEFLKRKLYFVNSEHASLVASSKTLICDGCLRNRNGTKLEAFLFDDVFVLTRPATRRGTLMYQVSIEPMLLSSIKVEEVIESEVKRNGSFKNTINRLATEKNSIRLTTLDVDHPKSYLLQARDDHDKKQWLNCIRAALPPIGSDLNRGW